MNSNPNSKPTLSIVIPAFNEEQPLRDVLESIPLDATYEIIVVDDGSIDNTFLVAKEYPDVRAVHHLLNRGYGSAVTTGFEIAKGDIIVTIDADAQNDPKEIPELIKPIISDEADIVIGSRYLTDSNDLRLSLIKRIGEKIIGFVLKKKYGVTVTNSQSGFKALRKEVLRSVLPLTEERFGFNTEFLVEAIKKGFKIVEAPKKEVAREYGKSKIKIFRDGFRIVYALIKSIFK
ncbi:MAG: glycosyltransferase family 2 protein [Promethearchaeota archaeon]